MKIVSVLLFAATLVAAQGRGGGGQGDAAILRAL